MTYDPYGIVEVPRAGVDARETDALEALLALCRIMGLHYKIEAAAYMPGTFVITLSWHDWPTDFFVPCKRDGQVVYIGATSVVSGLTSAIQMAVDSLRNNGNSFSRAFQEHYKQETGREWSAR